MNSISVRLVWLVMGAVLTAYVAGCGDGNSKEPWGSEPAAFYGGSPSKFCEEQWRVPVEREGAAARLVLGKYIPPESSPVQEPAGFYLRVENIGQIDLAHEIIPSVDKRINGEWVAQEFRENGKRLGFTLSGAGVPSGSIGKCVRVPLPKSWSSGRYRVLFPIDTSDEITEPPEMILTGYFVLPAGQ